MQNLRKTLFDLRYVLLVALLVLVAKALFLLMASLKGLSLTSWIIDDAFIEMAVARNIAAGHGFSYDFVHPTTGSPFLWTYLISINFWLFGQALAVKMSLILSSVFASAATIVVYLLTKHLTQNKTAAWVAFLLATFSGNAFFEAMNGMDTASFTFFALLAFAFYAGVGMQSFSATKRGIAVGIATGLALLTRGDGLFVAGTIGLMQLWTLWKGHDRKSALRFLIAFIITAGIGYVIITAWQVSVTGSPFLANQIGRREISLAWHHFSFQDFELGHYLQIVIWNVFQLEKLMTVATGATLLALVGLLFGFTRAETHRAASMMAIYTISFCGTLAAYQWYFADFHGLRYLNPVAHFAFVFVAVLLTSLFEHRHKFLLWFATASVIVLSFYAFYDLENKMPWRDAMSMVARPSQQYVDNLWKPLEWMKTNIPKGSVVGVRDHGRIALFTELPIQDIAGNIDTNVPKILKEPDAATKLKAYFRERHVDYLFLLPEGKRGDPIYQTIYDSFPLVEVPEASGNGSILYRIAWERERK